MIENPPQKKRNAIEKALEIMLSFRGPKPSWGIRELSGELGFSPATVQRILQVLKSYDFIRQDPQTRQYYIGNIFYRFLENLNTTCNLTGTGRRFMENLARETRETVHLNVIEGRLRICIDTIDSSKALKVGMPIGHSSPSMQAPLPNACWPFPRPDSGKNISEPSNSPLSPAIPFWIEKS